MIRARRYVWEFLASNLNLDITVNYSLFSTVSPVNTGVILAVSPEPRYITSFPVH